MKPEPKLRQNHLQSLYRDFVRLSSRARYAAIEANAAGAAYDLALETEHAVRNVAPGRTVDVWGDFSTCAPDVAVKPPDDFEIPEGISG